MAAVAATLAKPVGELLADAIDLSSFASAAVTEGTPDELSTE